MPIRPEDYTMPGPRPGLPPKPYTMPASKPVVIKHRVRGISGLAKSLLLGTGVLLLASLIGWREWPGIQFSYAVHRGRWFNKTGDGAMQIYQQVRERRGVDRANDMAKSALPALHDLSNKLFDMHYRITSIEPASWSQVVAIQSLLAEIAPDEESQARKAYAEGEVAENQAKADRAISAYQQAISVKTDWALAYNGLGRAFALKATGYKKRQPQRAGAFQQAEENFRTASRLDPAWVFPSQNLARTYELEERLSDAEQQIKATLAINSQWPGSWFMMGRIYAELNGPRGHDHDSDACDAYRHAVEYYDISLPEPFSLATARQMVKRYCQQPQ